MKEYRKRIAETIVTAREMANVSQRQLAGLLGRDGRTIQKWESGEIRLLVEDYLRIFSVLNVNMELFSKWLRHPELFPKGLGDISHLSSDRKRQAIAAYYANCAAPVEIEQEFYLLFGNHGSDCCGMLQEVIANLQTPLKERRRICGQILSTYSEAVKLGCLTDPGAPQPVQEILLACYNASAESLQAGRNGYAVNHLPFVEDEEEEQEKQEEKASDEQQAAQEDGTQEGGTKK